MPQESVPDDSSPLPNVNFARFFPKFRQLDWRPINLRLNKQSHFPSRTDYRFEAEKAGRPWGAAGSIFG